MPQSETNLQAEITRCITQSPVERVPLNVCAAGGQRFLSTDNGCEGSNYVRNLGYISANPFAGSPSPLYRFDLQGDWLTTIGTDEGTAAGYQNDGIIGYAL